LELKKITTGRTPPDRRRQYDDACAAAHALDLVGERWSLLVIRELMLGPRRFSDLRRGLPGISANVLSQRLSQLEDFGVVTRGSLPMLPGIVVYRLTDWGREIEPVFQALGRWGVRSPFRQGGSFSAASFLLSLRTMFDPAKAAGLRLRIGLVADGVALDARVADGRLSVEPGDITGADAALAGTAPALAGAIYGAEPVLQLAAAGAIRLTGAAAHAQAFCDLYALPPPAPLTDG
jgi:DNA-binding HxlR family transcriptional regulator